MAQTKINLSTKTGDAGTTSLGDGQRVSKTHPRIKAVGELDELNSWLGLVIAELKTSPLKDQVDFLKKTQQTLFIIGAEVALVKGQKLKSEKVVWLEKQMDNLSKQIKPRWRNQFVLPGGNHLTAYLDITRAICRRSERSLVALLDQKDTSNKLHAESIAFLNRLSDYLYLLARAVNLTA